MSTNLDFDGYDFRSLSRDAQIARCHEMAREAHRRAADANAEMRAEYTNLASRWAELAREMEETRQSWRDHHRHDD